MKEGDEYRPKDQSEKFIAVFIGGNFDLCKHCAFKDDDFACADAPCGHTNASSLVFMTSENAVIYKLTGEVS